MNNEVEGIIFKTATGKDWTWDLRKPISLPISIKQECPQCNTFIPRENMSDNLMGLQEGDFGLCVRNKTKVVTISTRKPGKCSCSSF